MQCADGLRILPSPPGSPERQPHHDTDGLRSRSLSLTNGLLPSPAMARQMRDGAATGGRRGSLSFTVPDSGYANTPRVASGARGRENAAHGDDAQPPLAAGTVEPVTPSPHVPHAPARTRAAAALLPAGGSGAAARGVGVEESPCTGTAWKRTAARGDREGLKTPRLAARKVCLPLAVLPFAARRGQRRQFVRSPVQVGSPGDMMPRQAPPRFDGSLTASAGCAPEVSAGTGMVHLSDLGARQFLDIGRPPLRAVAFSRKLRRSPWLLWRQPEPCLQVDTWTRLQSHKQCDTSTARPSPFVARESKAQALRVCRE